MKKIVLLLFSIVLLASCKSTSAVDNNVNYDAQKMVKGTWTLSNINYDNSNYIKVNLFDIASSDCFKYSNWNFISNNNKGTVMFQNGCAADRSITWYINKDGQMVLKFLNSESSRKTETGYVVDFVSVDDNNFMLRHNAMISNNPVEINMVFTRQ